MALASPRQQPTTVQQLTPPSSSHGGLGSWDFAVPMNNVKPSYADQKPFMSEDVPSTQPYPPRQPPTSQPNGVFKPPRSNTLDSQRQYSEEDYLVPSRVSDLHKKGSGDVSANGSDPDSVLEYYKGAEAKNGGRSASQPAGRRKTAKPANWTELEKDENNWIHRDKLKEIEIREMEEAGFRVGRASRSNSTSQITTRTTRGRKNSESIDPVHSGDDRPDYRRVVSPIPGEDEEGDDGEDEPPHWDLRTPEEIALDREQWAARHNQIIRPSTSRIPIAKLSPAPVPYTFVERDAPLPRSRKGSANWTGDAIATNGARVRSGSTSSQALMDEPEASESTSPIPGSPQKAKTPGKLAPTSGARKVSAQKTLPKPRNTSATSPVKRPGTSGGSISRPTTSHRPEGEAPWIATMYKPDPRLPPDQQIIPTHAKRIRQEQWETEGRVGSMYDREFRLLNTEEFNDRRASQLQPIDIEKAQNDQQWPLPSPTKPTTDRTETNVRSPTNEQGSYKLTPTIPQSPRIPSRSSNHRPAPTTSPKPSKRNRVPEPPADEEKENKGCCCIVM